MGMKELQIYDGGGGVSYLLIFVHRNRFGNIYAMLRSPCVNNNINL